MSKYYEIDSAGNEIPAESKGVKKQYVPLSAAATLTVEQSGSTFLLAATGKAITLPALGVWDYKFICAADIITTAWIITATAKVISGSAQVAGAAVAAALEDVITLVHTKALIGDWVTIECDGTKIYVEGSAVTAASLTFTGAL